MQVYNFNAYLNHRKALRNKKLNLNIVDTHAHLDMSQFDNDRDEVINRANNAGVNTIITIGIDLDSSRKAIKLAEQHPGILASIGIHPQESKGVSEENLLHLSELGKNPVVVGVGETGFDFYHNYSPREDQFKALEWQLEMAKSLALPVIIHSRQAQTETLSVLRRWSASYALPDNKPRGVIHCFNGDLKLAREYLDLGFFISIGGYIGYPSSASLRETVKEIPFEKLVLETDCPFLPPQKFRGKRNEPAYTLITTEVMAGLKHISQEDLAAQTSINADKIFHISEKLQIAQAMRDRK
jgi:TatD DNase family protein